MSSDFDRPNGGAMDHDPAHSRRGSATNKPGDWRPWLHQGLRAALGMRLRALPADIHPGWLVCLFVVTSVLFIAEQRLEIEGAAVFSLSGWLYSWAGTGIGLTVLGGWFLVSRRHWQHASPVMAWLTLEWVTTIVLALVGGALSALALGDHYPAVLSSQNARWGLFGLFTLWAAVAHWRIAQSLVKDRGVVAALVLSVSAVGVLNALWLRSSPWAQDYAFEADTPGLQLSQSVFEQQQTLFQTQTQALLPSTGASPQVYGLVYAPYAGDVFLRENQLVSGVMASRLGAQGRTLTLLNHASTTQTMPWATPTNLERGLKIIGSKMNRDQDVLIMYLTSHGGNDHRLASEHWPLNVPALTAAQVRTMLDEAGIRYRAVLISACFSGGWIDPLKSDGALVMTAADKDHTSYGCGALSELTFFGRAIFDEEMRHTLSFEQAFAQAVPRIKKREEQAGKDDGFSNPQMAVGEAFRAHWSGAVQPELEKLPH
jgi:hypothetical protein